MRFTFVTRHNDSKTTRSAAAAGLAVSLGAALLMTIAAGGMAAAQENPAAPQSSPQVQQPADGGVDWKSVGVGAGTVVANVGYIPAKMVYALIGGITGGAGYALTGGNAQTANTIWRSSMGGDYVLTPDMLRGTAPIHFSGPTTTAGVNTSVNSPPPGVTASNTTASASGIHSDPGTGPVR